MAAASGHPYGPAGSLPKIDDRDMSGIETNLEGDVSRRLTNGTLSERSTG